IPEQDKAVKDLLVKFINNGYVLNGRIINRQKGLAQGSPLSPILANLYLDSFDEYIQALETAMVRYSDDFVILSA
ncbi:MAG: reverse transcriptase domain-containing protein, partial [Nitrosopumilaceae archaeon]